MLEQRYCGGGRPSRGTPVAWDARSLRSRRPIAPSGPSHRFLRPRFAGTCLRRAPPPPPNAGVRKPPGGSPSSAQPLPLPYIVVSVWLHPICRCRWKGETLQVGGVCRAPKPVALTRGTHGVDYQFISTTDWYILSTRQLIYQIDFERLSRHGVTNRYSTCNTLATLTGKWHSVHSMCQRGKHFGKNGPKPCRVDRESAFCAICVSTRQWLLLRCVCPPATFRPSTCDTSPSYLQRI